MVTYVEQEVGLHGVDLHGTALDGLQIYAFHAILRRASMNTGDVSLSTNGPMTVGGITLAAAESLAMDNTLMQRNAQHFYLQGTACLHGEAVK